MGCGAGAKQAAATAAEDAKMKAIDPELRNGFATSLEDEHVKGEAGAVDKFFADKGVPAEVVKVFDPLREKVKVAAEPAAEIIKVKKSLGL